MLCRDRQPGLRGTAEAAKAIVRLPDHRGAAAIAALEFGPEFDAVGVLKLVKGNVRLGQAQFLALIQADRPAQAQKQRGVGACGGVRQTPARDVAHRVMVGIGPAGPGIGGRRVQPGEGLFQPLRCRPLWLQQLERVAHLHLVAAAGVFRHDLKPALGIAHLAHRRGPVRLQLGAESAQEFKVFRLVL